MSCTQCLMSKDRFGLYDKIKYQAVSILLSRSVIYKIFLEYIS